MKVTIIKTTFKSGRVEYYLEESPASEPFDKVVSEQKKEVEVRF